MPKGLDPQTVDIPVLLPNQTPPKHAGPLGRLTTMVNAQIKHFLPSSQAAPQKVEVIPRDGFTALTAAARDVATGAVVASPDWNNPELLAPLGNQLLSVCDSLPRVNNGANWSYYGNQRVVTRQLSEDVLHTTNHVLAASDEAYLNGVTCFTWTEVSYSGPVKLETAMVAFRADDGAWVRTGSQLYQNNAGPALARVVQDGTFFWVFFSVGTKIVVSVYDTNGVLIAIDATTIPQSWATGVGYWDVGAYTSAGVPYVVLVQPDGYSTVGANVSHRLYRCTVSGAVITIASFHDATATCNGPIALAAHAAADPPNVIVTDATPALKVFEYNGVTLATVTHIYNFGAVIAVSGSGIPDSLTGWIEPNGGGPIAHVAYSMLSNFSPPAGPPNDPGLRYTRSYACTRAGVVTLTNQVNGVLLQSRAFQVDQDWYAATYYQSGGGVTATGATGIPWTIDDATDYLYGDTVQPLKVTFGDLVIGSSIRATSTAGNIATSSPAVRIFVVPSQGTGAIAHNAGDGAVAATQTWTFLNATFSNVASLGGLSAFNSLLRVTGSSHAANNADFRVISVTSGTVIVTEAVSTTGTTMVDDTLAGVTASLVSTTTIGVSTELIGSLIPVGAVGDPWVGTVSLAGTGNPANQGTFTCFRPIGHGQFPNWPGVAIDMTMLMCTPLGTNVFEVTPPGETLFLLPTNANNWGLSAEQKPNIDVGNNLVVFTASRFDGATGQIVPGPGPNDSGPLGYPITAKGPVSAAGSYITGGQSSLVPQYLQSPLPTLSLSLADPTNAFVMHIAAGAFDDTWQNAYITLSGLDHDSTDGLYQVIQVLSATDVKLTPADGHKGQRNDNGLHGASISVSGRSIPTAFQPCWYLMPLSVSQAVAGRWEWAIAYADWRFDGATKMNVSTFERNGYALALSSVVNGAAGQQMTLPFRAQSFTAGQTVKSDTGGIIGIQSTAESTVGIKLFTIAASHGQEIVNSGEMLLPGMQAGEFSASGFTEDGVNLGPERPYIISQTTEVIALGLTTAARYQYVVVFEVMSESGDRIWSVTSPPIEVTLQSDHNTITLGGRMPGPTIRVVGVSIYRTATTGNPPVPTIQHYKITNDLQVNGPGFTFSSVNGGAANDTWKFVDQVPDRTVLDAETLLTDKGFLQRFPAPAFSQGVGSWQNRAWVVGYDGAIWMSGEKTEGDALWFHPAFRYVLPTDDKPVALASMDNYLIVFCSRSIWYIPAVQFPDGTGANGTLPNPQPLPFRNGCTGFAVTLREGVAYSSTAGGVWLINRSLINVFLSQPMQDSLTTGITGMAVDGAQRLVVIAGSAGMFVYDEISQAWLQWSTATTPLLLATWQGNATTQDVSRVSTQVPGSVADNVDGALTGIAPSIDMVLSIGGVKNMKRVWAINITGTVTGPCNLVFFLKYPDENPAAAPTTFYGPFAVVAGPLNIEINPKIEEATTYELFMQATFSGTPTGSYTLELLSAEVGIEPTLSKRPSAARIPGS